MSPSIVKVDDVDGLAMVHVSDCINSLAIHHHVLVNCQHDDRDSFHEQELFLVWKSRVLRLVKSETIESIIILDEEDEED